MATDRCMVEYTYYADFLSRLDQEHNENPKCSFLQK